MKRTKCCSNCERGTPLHLTKDILCKYNGVVTPDYVCFKYKGSAGLSVDQQSSFKCVHCEYFLVQLDSPNQDIGKCKLFSARDYDGRKRNACSKFSKKILIEVS
ncbi:MAG: hypothetical protein K0R50_3165 [Eubacterium sp.]|jgi:hypothetical protein|nr:hypothetical protein [Eubacterium sp.]